VRVLVLGAGAVGSLLGARLALAGEAVLLVGRPAHVEAIRRDGLVVEGEGGGSVHLDASSEIPAGRSHDAVLVTVKTFDLRPALTALARSTTPTPTLLAENGLGILEVARVAAQEGGWSDAESVLVRGISSIPATFVAPGVVRAAGSGELCLPAAAGPAAAVFQSLLARGGIRVRAVASIAREEWRKALVNAAINPVTAVHRVPNGALARGPLREEARALLREALPVAAAEGFPFEATEVDREVDRIVGATRENRSSMLQDLDRGRPTEIDAISGEIVRRGARHGLALPATAAIVARVEALAADGARTGKP
jgi:2-dehydropantoate 2-reductase